MFINHTHHDSRNWSTGQLEAAHAYGSIQDLASPEIPADWNETEVLQLAETYAARLIAMQPKAVLCQGEFTYTYALVDILTQAGIPVLAACSERQTIEKTDESGNTYRTSIFKFVQFRCYATKKQNQY